MYFKNAQIYRLPAPWAMQLETLAAALAERPFVECSSQQSESRGWTFPREEGQLVRAVGSQWLICLKVATRMLPASVVKQELEKRVAQMEKNSGAKVTRRERRDLKEQIAGELLAKAFVRYRSVFAWIDPVNGWLVVDTSSKSKADEVIEVLSDTITPLDLALPNTNSAPTAVMTEWLANGEAALEFQLAGDCSLRAGAADSRSVTYRNGLDDSHIQEHLAQGKQPLNLSLTYADRLTFTLTDALELRKIKLLDVTREAVDGVEGGDEIFNAEFALMTGELQKVLKDLIEVHGGEVAPVSADASASDTEQKEAA